MTEETVYIITTEGDVEGRSITTLGYATGTIEDIQTYYNDKKMYEITVKPITVRHITKESANEKKVLLEKKKDLEQQLKAINESL